MKITEYSFKVVVSCLGEINRKSLTACIVKIEYGKENKQ